MATKSRSQMTIPMRWLKATFEGVRAFKAFDLLEAQDFNPEGGSGEGVLVFFNDRPEDALCEAIWALNGGLLCEVVVITEEEAEKYL